jgi:hypothetical protein
MMADADHVIIPVGESEIERFSPAETEMSDGVVVRGWGYRDDRLKRLYVILGCVLGVLGCVFVVSSFISTSILVGSVNSGIQTLVTQNNEAEEAFEKQLSQQDVAEFKIVSWCPCGRTLPANTIQYGMPKEDETCFGCYSNFDTLAVSFTTNVQSTWPKTDYDPNEGANIHSFVYQMNQYNLTDETIVTKCGWHKEGTAYYAYEQEQVDVRMCVLQELYNNMAVQKWFPYNPNTYYGVPNFITFGRSKA